MATPQDDTQNKLPFASFKAGLVRLKEGLVKPHPSIQEIGAGRQAQLLAVLSPVLALLTTAGMLAMAGTQGGVKPSTYGLAGITIAGIISYILARSRYYLLGSALLTTSLSASAYLLIWSGSEPAGTLYSLVPLAFLFSSVLLPFWGMALLVLGNITAITLIPTFAPQVPFTLILFMDGILGALGILFLVTISFRNSVERERLEELKSVNQELHDLQATLEQHVSERTRDLALSAEVGRNISQLRDLDSLLKQAVDIIRERFELNYTQIYLTNTTGRTLILRAGTGSVGDELLRRGHHLPVGPGSINGMAAGDKEVVIVSDTAKSRTFKPNPLLPETRSEMAIPLLVGERVVGVLDLQSDHPGALTGENLPAFEALAGQLAIAIENAALFAQTQEARAEVEMQARRQTQLGWQEFLNAVEHGERIGFVYDQNGLTPTSDPLPPGQDENTLTMPMQVIGEPMGMIRLERAGEQPWTHDEKEIVAAVASQASRQLDNLRLIAQAESYRAEAEAAARRLTREGWQEYLETAATEIGYTYNQNQIVPFNDRPVPHEDIHSYTKPLQVGAETIGELAFDGVDGLDPETTELVTTVTETLSVHIESLRLLEETERSRQQLDKRATELETVAKVSTAAATILSPNELLQSIVDLTKYSFNLYHSHIYLLNPAKDALVLRAGSGKVGHRMVSEGETIHLIEGNSVVVRAARTLQAVVVSDVRNDPNFLPHALLPDVSSEMAVPMIVGDQLLGVFDVLASEVDRFSEEDLRTYMTLASQAAVALRNAELYAEQMAAVGRLRELDHLKNAFLANMSHELRTPLNSIMGFAQVILEGLDGPLTEDMNNDLLLIDKNGKHLLNLINEILDMAKIEAGRMSLSPEPVNLRDLLNDVIETSTSLIREKSLYLTLESEEQADLMLMLDRLRMRQVFLNLVGNASKFTEEGGITIQVERLPSKVLVRFRDTGIGVRQDMLERVFEAFSQVDTSTTRKAGGTGLGLPISRRLVEMHGGHLWAESSGEIGEGSTFIVELPVTPIGIM